jgi:cytochrome c-type protein NapB
MRSRAQLSLWILIGSLPFLAAGAGASDKETDDGIDVFFRNVNVTDLSDQALETYIDTDPGESKLLDRAFPGAPPQIPHSVEGMYPITLGSNDCIDCHGPDNVTSKEDRPIPKSHFSRPVMGKGGKGEPMAWVVKGYEDTDDVAGARYDCRMCHTPQATNVDTPASDFVRVKGKQPQ